MTFDFQSSSPFSSLNTCNVKPLFLSLIAGIDVEFAVVGAPYGVVVEPLEVTMTGGASRAGGTARSGREVAVVARRSTSAGLICVGTW